ncbi:hypothetical protein ACRAWF_46950, partial [Streptomyces sp. L7]
MSLRPGPPSTGTRWISGTRLRQVVYARWRPSGRSGVADLGAVDGEAPGAAPAVDGGQPEVVLGHEAQEVSVEVRQAQIAHRPYA